MFRDSLGWGVLRDRIQLERIFGFPRPNPYHHYCYFVSFCPLQISDPPSTTITLLNALIKKVTQKKKKKIRQHGCKLVCQRLMANLLSNL